MLLQEQRKKKANDEHYKRINELLRSIYQPKRFVVRAFKPPQTIEEFKEFYKSNGAKATILAYMIKEGKPLHLYDIFRFHQEVAGVTSDNSTRKALKRLIKDGLVEKIGRGLYQATPEAKYLIWNSIDWSRVRTKFSIGSGKGKQSKPKKRKIKNIEAQIQRVYRIARSLSQKGDKLRAVSLLAHTYLGIHQTGVLLYRKKGLFIYYEHKDKSIRALYSEKLGKLFDELGLPEGELHQHIHHRAGRIIHNVFNGYKEARRMHYYLKEEGWFPELNVRGKYYYFANFHLLRIHIGNSKLNIRLDLDDLDEHLEALNNNNKKKKQQKKDRYGIIRTTEHTKEENDLFYFNF